MAVIPAFRSFFHFKSETKIMLPLYEYRTGTWTRVLVLVPESTTCTSEYLYKYKYKRVERLDSCKLHAPCHLGKVPYSYKTRSRASLQKPSQYTQALAIRTSHGSQGERLPLKKLHLNYQYYNKIELRRVDCTSKVQYKTFAWVNFRPTMHVQSS